MQLICIFCYSNSSFNKPHDYIITLDEGEIGLPDKYFYNRDQNDEVNNYDCFSFYYISLFITIVMYFSRLFELINSCYVILQLIWVNKIKNLVKICCSLLY